ncbi:hypothetical protein CBL_04307 [Carabus blaptoides fortunei]
MIPPYNEHPPPTVQCQCRASALLHTTPPNTAPPSQVHGFGVGYQGVTVTNGNSYTQVIKHKVFAARSDGPGAYHHLPDVTTLSSRLAHVHRKHMANVTNQR